MVTKAKWKRFLVEQTFPHELDVCNFLNFGLGSIL